MQRYGARFAQKSQNQEEKEECRVGEICRYFRHGIEIQREIAVGDDQKEEQQKDKSEVCHKKVKPRRFDRLFAFYFRQNELPGGEAHDFPEKEKDHSIARGDDTEHRKNKCEVVHQKVFFAPNVRQVAERIEEIGHDTQRNK